MKRGIPRDLFHVRSQRPGPCCVYVLPCAYEEILKLGISQDPSGRMKALHDRYFAFFDLSRSILVETETVRDARDLELMLGRRVRLHQAPSPLVVRREAAGHTEWYRRAYEPLVDEIEKLSRAGHVVHVGLHGWLRNVLISRSDRLYSWAESVLATRDCATDECLPDAVRNTLDAYGALDIDVAPLLPDAMWKWYRHGTR